MVMQTMTNRPEFHSVFADSLIAIINKLATDETQAKKIMIFNIRQSYILYRMDTPIQRTQVDALLLGEMNKQKEGKSKVKGVVNYDYILKEELDEMKLGELSIDELEIKMFTFMTLAGIKAVQNTAQRAAGYAKFTGIAGMPGAQL